MGDADRPSALELSRYHQPYFRTCSDAKESVRAIVVHNVVHKARHQHSHNDRMLEAGKAKQSKQVMTTRCFGLLQQPQHCRHQCKDTDARSATLAIASEGCARTDYPIPSSVFEDVSVCDRESVQAIVVHNVVHKARHQRSPYRPNVRGWQGKAKQTSDDDTMLWVVAATALPPAMQVRGRS